MFGVFLVHIFPDSGLMPRDTRYLSVFNPNARKYKAGKFQIRTLFTLCFSPQSIKIVSPKHINIRIPFRETSSLPSLTHFSPMSHFYSPWKRQKTKGGTKMWHWTKIGFKYYSLQRHKKVRYKIALTACKQEIKGHFRQ